MHCCIYPHLYVDSRCSVYSRCSDYEESNKTNGLFTESMFQFNVVVDVSGAYLPQRVEEASLCFGIAVSKSLPK